MRVNFKSIIAIMVITLMLVPLIPPKIAKAATINKYYKTSAEAPATIVENEITYTKTYGRTSSIKPQAWQSQTAHDRWKYT